MSDGRNVQIEYRWADGHYDRLSDLAADLIRRRVDVIAAGGTSAPGLVAKAATSTIPIVFQTGSDPVVDGLVASMNCSGGNITGVSRMTVTLDPKRLGLLHEVVPKAKVFGFLMHQNTPRPNSGDRSSSERCAIARGQPDNRQAQCRERIGALLRNNEPTGCGRAAHRE